MKRIFAEFRRRLRLCFGFCILRFLLRFSLCFRFGNRFNSGIRFCYNPIDLVD